MQAGTWAIPARCNYILFLTVRVAKYGKMLPREIWHHHPHRYSKLKWTKPLANCSNWLRSEQEAGVEMPQGPFKPNYSMVL